MPKKILGVLLSVFLFQAEIPVYAQSIPLPAEPFKKNIQRQITNASDNPNTEEIVKDPNEAAILYMEEENASAAASSTVDGMISRSIEWMRQGSKNVLNETFLSSVSSVYTDWRAFCLGRLGIADNYSGFLNAADLHVRSQYAAHPLTGVSSDAYTATEFHRLSIALLAAGGDPTHIGGQNLIADGVYNCLLGDPWRQGVNGAAWALLTLDSNGYQTPAKAAYNRDKLLSYLLEHEIRGGGWAVDPDSKSPGADLTGTVIDALAPYGAGNSGAREAANRGLNFLRRKIRSSGGLEDCETTARAIIAYASMGIDPASITSSSGKNLIDGLTTFYNEKSGGFYHVSGSASPNNMATDQAIYSLIAYQRFLRGDTNLFDFRAPANTAQYIIRADNIDYTVPSGPEATVLLPPDTSRIQILNLPIGSYDFASVTVNNKTFSSSYRREDGSSPVTGNIPITSGDALSIQVSRQNGSSETWHLSIEMSSEAKILAVQQMIAALPEAGRIQLSDETAVNAAKKSYNALTAAEKESVTNFQKLDKALKKIQQLKQKEKEQQKQKRQSLKDKINALKSPARISQKTKANRYLRELEELEDWSGKAALKKKIKNYLKDIQKREAVIAALDRAIWNRISPLKIRQEDASTVKALRKRYSALSKEERTLLNNRDSLLQASEIINSLAKDVIPAKIFENIRTTKETFTYTGKLDAKSAYTLTYDGNRVPAAKDIDAKVQFLDTKNVENAVAGIEFLQKGSMNGTVTFHTTLDVKDGLYHLYWYNPDKSVLQSAPDVQVSNQALSMEISMGGKYWLSSGIVRLPGQSPAPTQAAAANNQRTASQPRSATPQTRTASPQATPTGKPSANTAAKNTESSGNTLVAKGKNGRIVAADFEKIKGKDQNLKINGSCGEDISYTLTFYGKDIKKAIDFPYEIQPECENSSYMQQLGDEPLILCMEAMEEFPGEMLVSMDTPLEDDTYLLFSYDPENQKAEYVKKAEVTDGQTRFTLSQGGDYFLAKRAKAGSLLDTEEEYEDDADLDILDAGEQTAQNTELPQSKNGGWKYALTAVFSFGSGIGSACLYKRKKGRKWKWRFGKK